MVGAVVVREGVIAGEGFHQKYGEQHAEIMALKAAGDRARGSTLYVTLEPCNHFGKTPPCSEAIIEARVGRVVIAAPDPTALAGGGGRHLSDYGLEVDFGVEEKTARELNASFFFSANAKRPWVTLKLALSQDGKMNDPSGEKRWITGESARAEVHRLRANADAIAVGLGTIRADDPKLTVRGSVKPRVPPMRVVFDRNAGTPLDSQVVRSAREVGTIIFAHHPPVDRLAALHNAGAGVFDAENLNDALEALRSIDVHHVMVEGGARVASALLSADLVDRLIIFQSPVTLGPGGVSPFEGSMSDFLGRLKRFPVLKLESYGEDVMTVYAIHEA
jgi:diaminohydroxyphosphoribosylaminopyrimidine deaminase/5-amino-6-(5-phosphoribosylamino)uracil reductase